MQHPDADLLATTALGVGAVGLGLGPARGTPLALVATALAVPATGYAAVAALGVGADPVERAGLAVAAGGALVALLGVGLAAAGALGPATAAGGLLALTLAGVAVAALRRSGLRRQGREDGTDARREVPAAFVAGLALVGLLAAVWLVALPWVGGADLVAFGVEASGPGHPAPPDALAAGTAAPVELTLSAPPGTYTVVVRRERAGSVSELDRLALSVGPEGRTVRTYRLRVDEPGRHRIAYLLYEGDAPATPDRESARQRLHHWVRVGNATANATAREAVERTPSAPRGGDAQAVTTPGTPTATTGVRA